MTSQGKNTEVSQDESSNLNSVGALLQASRLRLGHDLRHVAQTLHIRYIYLEAIEAGRYEELPGAVYVAGFMRSYADFLGLDSAEVVRRSKDEIASQSVNTELVFPEPIPESSIPGGAIVLVGVVIFFLVYGGWYASTTDDTLLNGSIPSVPKHLSSEDNKSEVEGEPTSVTVEETKEPVSKDVQTNKAKETEKHESTQKDEPSEIHSASETQGTEKIVDKPVTEESDLAAEALKKQEQEPNISDVDEGTVEASPQNLAIEPQPETEPTSVDPSQSSQISEEIDIQTPVQSQDITQPALKTETTAENKIYGLENKDSKILVRARRNSWIQVRDKNANKLLLTQLLKTGDSYQVPNKSGLVLLTGNAGALEILVEGKLVPDLAPPGTILKNITLDPDKLRQGSAAQ